MLKEAVHHAIQEAQKSVETFRHGAVLLEGRCIVASGRNKNDNPCGLNSIHAEMDAVWKTKWAPRGRFLHMVVVRLRQDQEFGMSRPCLSCQRLLRRQGISRVTYSTGDERNPWVTECFA